MRNALLILAVAGRLAADTPLEPGAILEALRARQVVALGDHHGNERVHALRLALIRDPRFLALVNDIVVEFGTARYQDVMDRFVRGEDVPYSFLRRAWQDTTQPEPEWDLPVYEEFFREVRRINAALPRDRQLRVLLGDPPIDWERVHTIEDLHREMGDRDAHAVEVIRKEVLGKNRRALVIYGNEHLPRFEKDAGAFVIPVDMRSARVAQLAPELCSDAEYMKMRLGRLALLPAPPGAPVHPGERLQADCVLRGKTEIADGEPALTGKFRELLQGAKSDIPLSPPMQRILRSLGALDSLTLVGDAKVAGKRFRRYRAVFGGKGTFWTVGISEDGRVLSVDPRFE